MGKNIGVEIGSDTLKLAVCKDGKIINMAVERLPDGLVSEGRIAAPAALSQFIKKMCADYKIRRGACSLVLDSKHIIARNLQMAVMGEAELKLNLPFEFRDFVGKEGSMYEYDYAMPRVKDNVLELYAAAVRKEVLEEYSTLLRRAGLSLKVAMPEEMAWINLIRAAKNEPKKLCVVDVGAEHTRVNIFSDDRYVMGKDIEIGGKDLDKAIAESEKVELVVARSYKEDNVRNVEVLPGCIDIYAELSVEIMRIINFYCSTTPEGNELRDIYFCGGGSSIEPLRTAIIKRTNFTAHHVRRLIDTDIPDNVSVFCALAAGAAMQLR